LLKNIPYETPLAQNVSRIAQQEASMPESMTPRERVLTALRHEEPDRVPSALWGSYYTLQDETYFKILKHLNLGDPLPPFRRYKTRNSNYYDDRVLERLGTDTRYVWSGFTDLGGAPPDSLIDAWGVQWQRMGPNITSVGAPLAGLSAEQIEAYNWPEPEDFMTLDLLKERTALLRKEGSYAIVARAVNSYGPFEQAAELRGREQFYMDMVLEPEITNTIINKVTDIIVRTNEIYLDVCGNDIDIFEIPGDDYGGTEDMLLSPASFDVLLKPALSRIVNPIKQYRSDLYVAFHTDGAIMKILDSLCDTGIDILNPLEPLPANDWEQVKKDYGARLSFMGGIDLKKAMPGTVKDVEEDVKRCIATFASGGGYILTPANHLQTDVPPENIVALYESCRKHGVYT
jgi:uroporphyrinogen decarboxylase